MNKRETIEKFMEGLEYKKLMSSPRPNVHITKDMIVDMVIILNTTNDVNEFLEMI